MNSSYEDTIEQLEFELQGLKNEFDEYKQKIKVVVETFREKCLSLHLSQKDILLFNLYFEDLKKELKIE